MMKKLSTVLVSSAAVLLHAGVASAEVSADPNDLVGSDTLDQVMDDLLATLPGLSGTGILNYNGLGSSSGERQLEGTPNADEPACTDDNGGENSGCQEIAPMSREMDSSICDDGEAAGNAEGIAFCADGLVLYTDNQTAGQYGDSSAACDAWNAAGYPESDNTGTTFVDHGMNNLRNAGTLPNTGYVVGANFAPGEQWKDVIRVIYTGCQNDQGDCVNSVDRLDRCGDAVRQEVIDSWANIVEGQACAAGDSCPDGLRRAYRRDDNSGTTGVFLSFIGVTRNLASRPSLVTSLVQANTPGIGCNPDAPIANQIRIRPIPGNHSFCDGGMFENTYPDCQDGVLIPVGGDPIRKPCADEDDICAPDGLGGVVQAVRSTREGGFPAYQCNRGLFQKTAFLNSAEPVCPDGSVPSAGQCNVPYYRAAGQSTPTSFDCINPSSSRPATAGASLDGRAYNHVFRADSATPSIDFVAAGAQPEVANWRMNMVEIDTNFLTLVNGKAYAGTIGEMAGSAAAGDYVCTEANATSQIGCVVANTTCTMGFAGRQAVWDPAGNNYQASNEPFQLQDAPVSNANVGTGLYPFARPLWVNAIGGFENMSADCAARGDSAAYCADQILIAEEFYNVGMGGNLIDGVCSGAGYIPFAAAECKGATEAAGCGAPTVQALSACEPL